MTPARRTAVLAALLLVPALAGCGDQTKPDASEWGTSTTPGAESPSVDSTSQGVDLEAATVSRAALSDEQSDLYEDVLLLEEPIKARAEQSTGAGGSTGPLVDTVDDGYGLLKPEGTRVATGYQMQWKDGKVVSYVLETDSGERMTWESGKILVDHPIDTPEDAALQHDMAKLTDAVDEWVAVHDELPSVSDDFGDVVLVAGLFGEPDEVRVKIAMSESVDHRSFKRYGDELTVEFESTETGEKAVLTQDGTTFSTPLEVV